MSARLASTQPIFQGNSTGFGRFLTLKEEAMMKTIKELFGVGPAAPILADDNYLER